MRIPTGEFQTVPLRVHGFLDDLSPHDVWAVDLPRIRSGITLDEFLRAAGERILRPSRVVRGFLAVRFFVGWLLGWDGWPESLRHETFAARLTAEDRTRSLAAAGTPAGSFRTVYRFANEQLVEILNRTVHAAAVSALVEMPTAYRFYFAVYVRPVSRLTHLYMSVINPFRKLIIYPSLLRSIQATWNDVFS